MDEDRGEHGQLLVAAEDGGVGDVEAEPEEDLAKVVRVARERPQARGNELALRDKRRRY